MDKDKFYRMLVNFYVTAVAINKDKKTIFTAYHVKVLKEIIDNYTSLKNKF